MTDSHNTVPAIQVDSTLHPNDMAPPIVPLSCRGCRNNVVNTVVNCPKCNAPFHPSCAEKAGVTSDGGYRKCCGSRKSSPAREGFTIEELMAAMRLEFNPQLTAIDAKVTTTQETLTAIDTRVTQLGEDVRSITQRVTDAEHSIEKVTRELTVLQQSTKKTPGNTSNMTDCLREFEDRNQRKKNIIIYGIAESNEKDTQSRVKLDLDKVSQLFSAISYVYSASQPLKILRIGKYSPNLDKPRPIKVILDTFHSVTSITQAFAKLRKSSQLPPSLAGVGVTSDKTTMQQHEYRLLKAELTARTKGGETGLRIATKNGSATIVRALGASVNPSTSGHVRQEST